MSDTPATLAPVPHRLVRRVLLATCVAAGSLAAQGSRPAGMLGAESARRTASVPSDDASRGATTADRRRMRLARLDARWDSLSHAAADAAALRFAAVTSDTIEAGAFVVRTSPSLRQRVVRAALDASRELQFTLDANSLAAIRAGDISVVALLGDGSAWRRESLLAGARHAGGSCCELPAVSRLRPDPLPGALRNVAVDLVSRSFDRALREWLLQSPLPLAAEPSRQEEDARVELGTSESQRARACLTGDDHACSLLLDLRGRPADPLTAWYSREDYRALVERVRLAPTDGRNAPRLQRECLAGAIERCETLLHSLDRARVPSPTLPGPRLSLVRHALVLGGLGALQRLRSTPGDIGTRLAAASRLDERQLLGSWRASMTDPAQATVHPTAPIAAASVCWIMALSGLALGRTRRCR